MKMQNNLCIDWFQVTLKFLKHEDINFEHEYQSIIYYLFKYLFNIESNEVLSDNTGINAYTHTFYYSNIKMLVNPFREEMGINILMSGDACRQYENLGLNFKSLFNKIREFEYNCTRIDLAIDIFDNTSLSIKRILPYIKNGYITSKFNTFSMNTKNSINCFDVNNSRGDTLYFGTRASLIQFVLYDKLRERQENNYILDNSIIFWERLECRFRQERANELIDLYFKNDFSFNNFLSGVILNYLDIKDFKNKDKNKSRWKTAKWYLDFLETTQKLELSTFNYETSILKKKNWLDNSVSRSNLSLFLCNFNKIDDDDSTYNYLLDFLNTGLDKIENKDLQLINEYRKSKNMNAISLEDVHDLFEKIENIKVIFKE